jgi:phosphohistidine phosphatase
VSKKLILVRHAKSAWPDDVSDHDRPLAERGRRDAPAVGRWLAAHDDLPEVALVSSAVRAQETFALLNAELARPIPLVVSEEVYGAGTGSLLDLVRALGEDLGSVMIIGHNPGIGMLAALLDERRSGHLDFKTSAIAIIDIGRHWTDADPGHGRLIAAAVPRG